MDIELPKKVKRIISVIQEAGYEAYAVGGCVRDSILGRQPDDWDIATSAVPCQIKELFPRTIDTGIQHGTVTVMLGKEGFEVTTYRIDGEYEDSRHPKDVTFTSEIGEDLARRDFTVNAMAYNDRQGLVDLFGGMEDIRQGILRCVGVPQERFGEDALRMMRALRFSAQLGYTIDQETRQAIQQMAGNLVNISAERIQTELVKLVVSPHPDYLRDGWEMGITKIILPEFDICMETEQNNPHHCYTVGEHILKSMKQVRADKVLRLTMLFHDMGKPVMKSTDEEGIDHFYGHVRRGEEIARQVLKRLKFDNETINQVCQLVLYHDYPFQPEARSLRRAIHKIGNPFFPQLFEVKRADMLAQSLFQREEKSRLLAESEAVYKEILQKQDCVSLRTLAVKGKDLIGLGMESGPKLGKVLEQLLELVLENPEENTRERLLEQAEKLMIKVEK
ncbi:MAG: HD domain-containing protein [Lachnospiraceae bacterium]|nr:HD domain-containing protein [Lachnospiraceae bacterium]